MVIFFFMGIDFVGVYGFEQCAALGALTILSAIDESKFASVRLINHATSLGMKGNANSPPHLKSHVMVKVLPVPVASNRY